MSLKELHVGDSFKTKDGTVVTVANIDMHSSNGEPPRLRVTVEIDEAAAKSDGDGGTK